MNPLIQVSLYVHKTFFFTGRRLLRSNGLNQDLLLIILGDWLKPQHEKPSEKGLVDFLEQL